MVGKKQKYILKHIRDKDKFLVSDFKHLYPTSKKMLQNAITGLEIEGFIERTNVIGLFAVNRDRIKSYLG